MTKLDANGRWESSRILLPEHREALIERKLPKPTISPVPGEAELKLIRDHVLLQGILNYAQKGRRSAELIEHIMKDGFLMAIDVLIDRINADLVQARKKLRSSNIKIWEDELVEDTMWYRYLYRGYEGRTGISRDLVRKEMSVRIGKYFAAVFK